MLKLDEVGGIGPRDRVAKGVKGFVSLRLERVDIAGGNSERELWGGDTLVNGGAVS